MMFNKKEKSIAVFLNFEHGIPKIIGMKEFKVHDADSISFKKKSFAVNSNVPTLKNLQGNILYYFDVNGRGQMVLDNDGKPKESPIESLDLQYDKDLDGLRVKIMDAICEHHVVADLLRSADTKMNWMQIIMYVICGLGIGAIIGIFLPVQVI